MVHLRKNYIGDLEQVASINAKVGKKDTLIILGDIGNIEMVKRLRGHKVLVMGNHDRGSTLYEECFDEVYEGPVFIAERLLLSHEPIALPFAFNIHGHDHAGREAEGKAHLNVCAENIDYTPVNLTRLLKRGLLKDVESIHRVTIDGATARKKARGGRKYGG
jgi:calcineurin-like phosphoesterase family protein